MLPEIKRTISLLSLVILLSACTTPGDRLPGEDTTVTVPAEQRYFNQAIDAARKGNAAKAAELLEIVTQINPVFAGAHTNLGLQYLRMGRIGEAEQVFEKAVLLDSGDAVAYNHLGVLMRKRGAFDDAEDMYKNAIRHDPEYANAHYNIAVLYDIYLYDLERAMLHYRKYRELSNDNDGQVSMWIVDLERKISAQGERPDR